MSPIMNANAASRVASAALATCITLVCVAMAAAAASERAPGGPERWLITALASLIVLCLHLAPVLLGQRWSRSVLVGVYLPCLLVTLYGHAHFFMAAQARQGAVRAAAAPNASDEQARVLHAQLDATVARAPAVVAADLAQAEAGAARTAATLARCRAEGSACGAAAATDTAARARLTALRVEQAQADTAARLRERLASLTAADQDARVRAAVDPVDAELANLLGMQPRTLGLFMALLQSLLAEVLAGALWVVALGSARSETLPPATAGAAPVAVGNAPSVASASSASSMAHVKQASGPQDLRAGNDHPTVPGHAAGQTPAARDPPASIFFNPATSILF